MRNFGTRREALEDLSEIDTSIPVHHTFTTPTGEYAVRIAHGDRIFSLRIDDGERVDAIYTFMKRDRIVGAPRMFSHLLITSPQGLTQACFQELLVTGRDEVHNRAMRHVQGFEQAMTQYRDIFRAAGYSYTLWNSFVSNPEQVRIPPTAEYRRP